MGFYTTIENYLKGLCINHPDVRHGAVVDGVMRKSFFRINDEEELTEGTVNGIAYPCVAFVSLTGRIKDTDNALWDIRHSLTNAWMFLTHINSNIDAEGIGNADRIQAGFDLTFSIMEDFIKSMKDDYEVNDRCGAFERFDLNRINYVQIGPLQQNEYGWILYFDAEYKASRIFDGSAPDPIEWPPLNPYRTDPEIIYIINEDNKNVAWTDERKNKYGLFPTVEVWLRDDIDVLHLAEVQPTIDAPPPAFTQMFFKFSGLENGFIVIK